MGAVIGLIAGAGDELRRLAGIVGIRFEDDDYDDIIARARLIAEEQHITVATGKDMLASLTKAAGGTSAETLTGTHNEVAVVINEREGTTLDRAKIKARYGNRL